MGSLADDGKGGAGSLRQNQGQYVPAKPEHGVNIGAKIHFAGKEQIIVNGLVKLTISGQINSIGYNGDGHVRSDIAEGYFIGVRHGHGVIDPMQQISPRTAASDATAPNCRQRQASGPDF